ncbi:MAG: hypothetical protein IKW96_07950 [Ruminococcus sp.]|uniref:hypothetical protein n=1 Tax=Ruminococcus sp. TaxID=41978 RepID=UPI002600A774|nr:hypothetical protein [Ruminococcus sp.]MBR5683198.1 hypothetical protein [Ruminococcus sp.]
MKKEFLETKTVVSPDGKTVTTMTVSGSSETKENSKIVSTTVTASTTTTSTTTTITTKSEEK